MSEQKKHIHIIGICGVATSAIAIALHRNGWKVTGSDKGFFPPVSTELEKNGISFYAGWHPEKMVYDNTRPHIVMVGTASGSENPETILARELGIPTYSYPEIIGKFFIKDNSIVVTGTWGKTSSSALLSFILEKVGMDPTYMFGGVSLSHEASAKLTDGKYNILEGDEYKSSPTDNSPKFSHYHPTHLLLTAISWDHADLYPTEESYFNIFKKLISDIPSHGMVVANKDNAKVCELLSHHNKNIIWYGKKDADFVYKNTEQTESGLVFKITHKDKNYDIHSPMIGSFQAENITGCFAMAHSIGIDPEKIIHGIKEFGGLKRRLEKRYVGKITVFDDIAHSPEKAHSVLGNLRAIYKGKIIAVFEPNIGGRSREAISKYTNSFTEADTVIIPRLTKLKIGNEETSKPIDGDELAEIISKTHTDTKYINNDETLVKYILENAKKDDVVVFLGSHGFRNMIEETVISLHQQSL